MVSFSCENCGDILTKKKLDPHRNRCRGASFTCIDCMTHFWGTDYRSHTTCMTEAQKYEGALYKPKPEKNQRRNNSNNNNTNSSSSNQGTNNAKQASKPANGHRAPYVEDAPDADNPASTTAAPPPPAPSPPPSDSKKPTHATPRSKDAEPVNVFDFLVTSETPNASKVSVAGPKEQMKMVDHAPSVFETSQALAELGADADDDDDEDKKYDVAYEENGFSYGSGPIPPSVYPNKAAPTVSMEFMTPAPKKKKDRSARTDGAATTSDKKRKRRTDDHGRDDVDTPMGEAPSSVVNHPGTPMLNHSGLTGGLNRMMRSPSLDADAGDGPADHPRRRYQDPSSPIKRTRRDDKETAGGDPGLGISMKHRAGRLVSSMFGGSVASTSSNGTDRAARSSRRRGSSDDGQSGAVDARSSKKTSRVRGTPVAAPDARKSKRKSSAPIDGDRPSRRLREIEYPDPAPRGDHGHEMVVYRQPNHPDALQQEMAAHFLSLVTKGPESGRGFSMNKVLKRFHRDVTDEFDADRGRETGRSRADRERRMDDEKELWRTLRVKQNERGEVVLFF